MTIDFATLTDEALAAKLAWYKARGDRFAAQIEAVEAELASRVELLPRSVVNDSYKLRYAVRNASRGKAMKRSCGDWLATTLAQYVLADGDKLDVASFEAVLDANGVKHSHWNRTTPGWQGRLRMTGRLALQRVVADQEALVLPDGTEVPAPQDWVIRTLR